MILSYPFTEQILLAAVAAQVLFLPGLIWIMVFKYDQRDIVERLADLQGLSISIMAILGMLFFFLGLRFSGGFLVLLFVILIGAVFYLLIRQPINLNKINVAWMLGTIFIVLIVVGFRFYQAKDLVFPAWVDSVQHVLITQKILEFGGLPHTLAPELNVPLHYHYGFHLIAALFSWISRLEPLQAVLWFGQVINALVVLGIYRLSKALWRKTVPAILAALLVGFAFQMPAYYVTWGRYTLLTGLLVMLPAMAVAYELVMDGFTRERAARLIILTAGLALVHYLALFYFWFFLLSLMVERSITWYRSKESEHRKIIFTNLWRMMLAAGAGILIAMPWLIRMLSAHASQTMVQIVLPKADNLDSYKYILYLLGPTHNYYLMGGALLGLVLIWWQRGTRAMALWSSLIILLAFPWGLRFGPFRPDHMAIILFIPAAIVLSYAWVQACEWLQIRVNKVAGLIVLVLGALGILGWGAWQTKSVLNPVTVLADQADWDALEWIDENVAVDARFLTNTAIWQYQTYRGEDGGYWIIPKTGRFALALPGLYGYAEDEIRNEWVNWMERASVVHACDDGFWSLVKDAQLTHVYLRDGKGSLQSKALIDCPNVDVVYHHAGVWIYKILATE